MKLQEDEGWGARDHELKETILWDREEAMTKNKVKAKGTVEFRRAVGYLEDVLEGMKNGRIVVRQGDQSVTFRHVDALEMEIEAKEKAGKQELSMEMTWREPPHVGEMAGLTITSEESVSEESVEQ
jgi:amphi-Trp domain-containing protein